MIFFWGLCRKLYCTGVGLWNHPFLWIGIYVNQPQCLGWDGMFPVGRLATSASQNPQPQLNGFVHELFGYRHTRDLHESTFIYNIVAINSTFLIFHTYCIRELIWLVSADVSNSFEQWTKKPGGLGYIGDELLPSYIDNKPWNKDPPVKQPGFNGKPFFECLKVKVKANGNGLDPKHPWKNEGFKTPNYIYIYMGYKP